MTAREREPGRLRVAVAAPLSTENRARIRELEPRVDLVVDHSLLPPMRWPADFPGDPNWQRTLQQQRAFEAALDSADALYGIPDVDPAALARVVRANPRLRWVHTMAAGGGSQVKAAGLRADELDRVRFTTSAGVHGAPLAEFAVFGVLAAAKNLPRLNRQQRDHEWSGRWTMRQVSEQTVLVLGLGGIGRVVAAKLHALGARVIGTSRRDVSVAGVSAVVSPDRIAEVAPTVDAVVNTLPGTEATEHLLGKRFFGALRPGASLVNVGRGSVVDEAALADALDSGHVGFAALDVFETEPLPAHSPLWDHDNVLVSPHTAALNAAEDRLIAELFAANATRLLDGERLLNQVNTVEFY
ncbi:MULTISPECIES: D-2-hydroxyacid dehydrogenase [unclassified Streptomyces]|uniref:D-2-hydroxyacid dehydrogenase n=1 Tax=unclassified Streptomyces TaxID=2593676 RepID=UPI002E15E862|nr:D-2-hydroxyacid dehydrogenase [Streptomyces sp. NBC_01186]WSS45800.1 D-2-hydroxyacid dehydrogenase [Streptomyces sp. NBC_01187]